MIYDISGSSVYDAYDIEKQDRTSVFNTYGRQITIEEPSPDPSPDPYLDGRLLIFEDDFTNGLLEDNWTIEVGHIRGASYQVSRPTNVKVQNNTLVLTAKKENHLGYTLSVAGMNSRGKKSWVYGRFEAKIKVPSAYNGAFWSMSNNALEKFNIEDDGTEPYTMQYGVEGKLSWPKCGEIDVMESNSASLKSRPMCNVWGDDGNSIGSAAIPFSINDQEWHIYAMEKTPTYLAMFVDGVEYKRYTYADFSGDEVNAYKGDLAYMLMLTNGISDESDLSVEEANMYVDWIRVYAPEGVHEPIQPSSITIQQTLDLTLGCATALIPEIAPATATERDVIWVSSDTNVVRCKAGGWLYGDQIGEADVFALTKNGKIGKCHVTVTAELADINDILIGTAWNLTTNSARAVLFVAVQPSTQYTLSFDSISNFDGVYWFEKESRNATALLVDEKLTSLTKTQVTTANTGYMCIQFNKSNISRADFEGINMSLVRSD